MITIREADLEADALAILDGARDFMSRMEFTMFAPKDDNALAKALGRVLSLEGVQVIAAESEGKVVGGIGMLYAPHLWNPEKLTAEELFWWTREDAPRMTAMLLVRTAFREMRNRGVDVATFKALSNSPSGVSKVYNRLGLVPVETAFCGAP